MGEGGTGVAGAYGGGDGPWGSAELAALNKLARRLEVIDAHQQQTARTQERHELLLLGDATTPGLLVRLDRIERTLGWFRWLATGGLAGVFGTLLLLGEILEALKS